MEENYWFYSGTCLRNKEVIDWISCVKMNQLENLPESKKEIDLNPLHDRDFEPRFLRLQTRLKLMGFQKAGILVEFSPWLRL